MANSSLSPRLDLRFAGYADIEAITRFIDKEWKSGHILSTDRNLFQYIYLEKSGRLNFVIAVDLKSGELIAILGFIPTNGSHSRVSLSMWKARQDGEYRKLRAGISVLNFLIDELKPKSLFSTGINPWTTNVIYEFLGYTCAVMDHHLVINENMNQLKILMNAPQKIPFKSRSVQAKYDVTMITNVDEIKIANKFLDFASCGKDVEYFVHRYFEHPRFNYQIQNVVFNGQSAGLIVTRRVKINGGSCLRIIDVVGGEACLQGAFEFLKTQMNEFGDEYLDLVSWGLDREKLESFGFMNRRVFDNLVVPDRFSPFVPANNEIWLFTNLPATEQFFKGDGDQDRPN